MTTARETPPPDHGAGPGCKRCSHYYITHDVNFPYGCRALGFKSRRAPYLEVRDASGLPCQVRQERTD